MSHLIANQRLNSISPETLLHALKLHVPGEEHPEQSLLHSDETLREILGGLSINAIDAKNHTAYVQSSALVTRRLGLNPGAFAILVNGRVCFNLSK
jgi:hypothetical protein